MRSPIIITGCPRSGDSIITQILIEHGCFAGDSSAATHWFNTEVTSKIVVPYLVACNCDEKGQNPIPIRTQPVKFPSLQQRMLSILMYQGYASTPWIVSDPRILLMWKSWHLAFPEAKWIFIRRETSGIVNSCMRTKYMCAFKEYEQWENWAEAMVKRIEDAKKKVTFQECWPVNVVSGDFQELRGIIEYNGLTWNSQTAERFVTPAFDLNRTI